MYVCELMLLYIFSKRSFLLCPKHYGSQVLQTSHFVEFQNV
jgi:hypothetical protein